MNKVIQYIKENAWAKYLLLFLGGVAVGAIFYPSKSIVEETSAKYEERIKTLTEEHNKTEQELKEKITSTEAEKKRTEVELTKKITSLTTEVRELKSKVKTSYYKLIKPDGTIEEKRFSESEVDESTKVITSIKQEFTLKILQIEERWATIHKDRVLSLMTEHKKEVAKYEERIKELESRKEVKVNERSTGVELGYLSSNNYYLHVSRDLFGPIFVGVHAQSSLGINAQPEFAIGGGIGFRW